MSTVGIVDDVDADRFAAAMAHALIADLEPGDAIFVPSMWWHHVRASAPLNVLVNYWHGRTAAASPFAALMHATYATRELVSAERASWRAWFEHYVFGDAARDAVSHLPEHARGVLGAPSPARDEMIKVYVVQALKG